MPRVPPMCRCSDSVLFEVSLIHFGPIAIAFDLARPWNLDAVNIILWLLFFHSDHRGQFIMAFCLGDHCLFIYPCGVGGTIEAYKALTKSAKKRTSYSADRNRKSDDCFIYNVAC